MLRMYLRKDNSPMKTPIGSEKTQSLASSENFAGYAQSLVDEKHAPAEYHYVNGSGALAKLCDRGRTPACSLSVFVPVG